MAVLLHGDRRGGDFSARTVRHHAAELRPRSLASFQSGDVTGGCSAPPRVAAALRHRRVPPLDRGARTSDALAGSAEPGVTADATTPRAAAAATPRRVWRPSRRRHACALRTLACTPRERGACIRGRRVPAGVLCAVALRVWRSELGMPPPVRATVPDARAARRGPPRTGKVQATAVFRTRGSGRLMPERRVHS